VQDLPFHAQDLALLEFLVISLFHETKIPMVDMKVQVSSNFSQKFFEKK
jgi:hypothetical protein